MTKEEQKHFEKWKKKYFTEPQLIKVYTQKNNGQMLTELELERKFKRAMKINE
jgi:hypothetical protein